MAQSYIQPQKIQTFYHSCSLLILYSTVDGHTKHICEYMSEKLNKDKEITISSVEESDKFNLSDFSEIVLGASVRYGYHRKNVYDFINTNKEILEKKINKKVF